MKFIKYPITVQYGKSILSIYEKMDNSIDIIKDYLAFKILDNQELNSYSIDSLKSKYPDTKITYNESNSFDQNLNSISISLNIEDNVKKIEKSNIESFIDSILVTTKNLNIDTFVEIKKCYESKLYIRLEKSKELKLNIDKYQKSIKIKLFLANNQSLKLNIID
ncbi:hypothetical protein RWY47_01215, partial [Paraclostridium sp. MRS3W1]